MNYYIYFNLHKHLFSVKNSKTKLVEYWTDSLTLENVQFKVSESGRNRVLKELRKNVHAYAIGQISNKSTKKCKIPISYNPYKSNKFIRTDTNESIEKAKLLSMKIVDNKPILRAYL